MRSRFAFRSLLAAVVLAILACVGAIASAQDAPAPQRHALIAEIKGVIGPATAHFLEKAIRKAQTDNAEVLILQVNTPGGLVTSMRSMVENILASPVPVVGYVSPPGAHAASAGTYILYATNIAAMAPGTNIGAATPVQLGGAPGLPAPPGQKPNDQKPAPSATPPSDQDALARKSTNDMVSFIRSLAELRHRNAEWAEKAVRQAATLHAREALDQRVVEIVAGDVGELLKALDGRKVTVGKTERALSTRGLTVVHFEPDFMTKSLSVLADPNVSLILMLVGIYGLIFELANPGNVLPGVIGAIALVFGLYSLSQLPLDYAGLALLLLGIGFMVAEAFTPSFGVLGVGGFVAFVSGAAMLIDSDIPEFQLSWTVILSTAALSVAFLIVLIGYVWRAHGLQVQTGAEQMVGSKAVVVDWAGTEGHVWVLGERWRARGDRAYAAGDELVVKHIEGLLLIVTALPYPEE